jgi:hypothetical protein
MQICLKAAVNNPSLHSPKTPQLPELNQINVRVGRIRPFQNLFPRDIPHPKDSLLNFPQLIDSDELETVGEKRYLGRFDNIASLPLTHRACNKVIVI